MNAALIALAEALSKDAAVSAETRAAALGLLDAVRADDEHNTAYAATVGA